MQGEEEESISTADYKLLLGACYLALTSAVSSESEQDLSQIDMTVVLSSLTHLLGPAFLPHFDLILLRDLSLALSSLGQKVHSCHATFP